MSESILDEILEQWRERGRHHGLNVQHDATTSELARLEQTIAVNERQLAYQHGYEAAFLGALRERIAESEQ